MWLAAASTLAWGMQATKAALIDRVPRQCSRRAARLLDFPTEHWDLRLGPATGTCVGCQTATTGRWEALLKAIALE
jgi:hypothetical protein